MKRSPMPPRETEMPRLTGLRSIGWQPVVIEGGLAGRTPVRKPQKATGFSAAVKLAARARAGNDDPDEARCEACGIWLGRYGGEIQHRKARKAGGTSLGVIDSIVNAVLLCGSGALRTGCHGKCENRDRRMQARGFWLEEGQDPVTEPIASESEHGSGATVYLLLNGTYGDPEPDGDGAA